MGKILWGIYHFGDYGADFENNITENIFVHADSGILYTDFYTKLYFVNQNNTNNKADMFLTHTRTVGRNISQSCAIASRPFNAFLEP